MTPEEIAELVRRSNAAYGGAQPQALPVPVPWHRRLLQALAPSQPIPGAAPAPEAEPFAGEFPFQVTPAPPAPRGFVQTPEQRERMQAATREAVAEERVPVPVGWRRGTPEEEGLGIQMVPPFKPAAPEREERAAAELARMGSVIEGRRWPWQSIRETSPGTALWTGLLESPEATALRAATGPGVISESAEALNEALGANPTQLEQTIRGMASLLTPASIALFAFSTVRLPAQVVLRGLTRVFGERAAAQAVVAAGQATVAGGTSFGGYNAATNALRQATAYREQGKPFSFIELGRSIAEGLVTGGAMGAAAIPGRMGRVGQERMLREALGMRPPLRAVIPEKAAQAAILGGLPPLLEGRLPSFEDLTQGGLFLAAMELGHAVPRPVAEALRKPRTMRTPEQQEIIDRMSPQEKREFVRAYMEELRQGPAPPPAERDVFAEYRRIPQEELPRITAAIFELRGDAELPRFDPQGIATQLRERKIATVSPQLVEAILDRRFERMPGGAEDLTPEDKAIWEARWAREKEPKRLMLPPGVPVYPERQPPTKAEEPPLRPPRQIAAEEGAEWPASMSNLVQQLADLGRDARYIYDVVAKEYPEAVREGLLPWIKDRVALTTPLPTTTTRPVREQPPLEEPAGPLVPVTRIPLPPSRDVLARAMAGERAEEIALKVGLPLAEVVRIIKEAGREARPFGVGPSERTLTEPPYYPERQPPPAERPAGVAAPAPPAPPAVPTAPTPTEARPTAPPEPPTAPPSIQPTKPVGPPTAPTAPPGVVPRPVSQPNPSRKVGPKEITRAKEHQHWEVLQGILTGPSTGYKPKDADMEAARAVTDLPSADLDTLIRYAISKPPDRAQVWQRYIATRQAAPPPLSEGPQLGGPPEPPTPPTAPPAEPPKPRVMPPVQGPLGNKGVATDAEGNVEFQWQVVDQEALIGSHLRTLQPNPASPHKAEGLQARDMDRVTSAVAVDRIAQNPRPELLGPSPIIGEGAIWADERGVVPVGNHRLTAILRMAPEKRELLRQHWKSVAPELGVDPAAFDANPRGVLVRKLIDPRVNIQDLARRGNVRGTYDFSSVEMAKEYANALDARWLTRMETPSEEATGPQILLHNQALLAEFLERTVPPTEQRRLFTGKGALSAEGLKLLQSIFLQRVYRPGPEFWGQAEAADPEGKNLLSAATAASPRLGRAQARYVEEPPSIDPSKYPDPGPDLGAALEKFMALKAKGLSVREVLSQPDLIGGGRAGLTVEQAEHLEAFENRKGKPRELRDYIERFARTIEAAPHEAQLHFDRGQTAAAPEPSTFRVRLETASRLGTTRWVLVETTESGVYRPLMDRLLADPVTAGLVAELGEGAEGVRQGLLPFHPEYSRTDFAGLALGSGYAGANLRPEPGGPPQAPARIFINHLAALIQAERDADRIGVPPEARPGFYASYLSQIVNHEFAHRLGLSETSPEFLQALKDHAVWIPGQLAALQARLERFLREGDNVAYSRLREDAREFDDAYVQGYDFLGPAPGRITSAADLEPRPLPPGGGREGGLGLEEAMAGGPGGPMGEVARLAAGGVRGPRQDPGTYDAILRAAGFDPAAVQAANDVLKTKVDASEATFLSRAGSFLGTETGVGPHLDVARKALEDMGRRWGHDPIGELQALTGVVRVASPKEYSSLGLPTAEQVRRMIYATRALGPRELLILDIDDPRRPGQPYETIMVTSPTVENVRLELERVRDRMLIDGILADGRYSDSMVSTRPGELPSEDIQFLRRELRQSGWSPQYDLEAETRKLAERSAAERILAEQGVEEAIGRAGIDPRYTQSGRIGSAGWIEDGHFVSLHMTDDPGVVTATLRAGAPLYQARQGGDLGGGLYLSGAAELWRGRGRRPMWQAIGQLPSDQRQALVDAAVKMNEHTFQPGYLSPGERDVVWRNLGQYVETGNMGLVGILADQPFNMDFERAARFIGLRFPEPQEVTVRVQGKLLNYSRLTSRQIEDLHAAATAWLAEEGYTDAAGKPTLLGNKVVRAYGTFADLFNEYLRHLGFDGAIAEGGGIYSPQAVIWNRDAVRQFGEWRNDRPAPGVAGNGSFLPPRPGFLRLFQVTPDGSSFTRTAASARQEGAGGRLRFVDIPEEIAKQYAHPEKAGSYILPERQRLSAQPSWSATADLPVLVGGTGRPVNPFLPPDPRRLAELPMRGRLAELWEQFDAGALDSTAYTDASQAVRREAVEAIQARHPEFVGAILTDGKGGVAILQHSDRQAEPFVSRYFDERTSRGHEYALTAQEAAAAAIKLGYLDFADPELATRALAQSARIPLTAPVAPEGEPFALTPPPARPAPAAPAPQQLGLFPGSETARRMPGAPLRPTKPQTPTERLLEDLKPPPLRKDQLDLEPSVEPPQPGEGEVTLQASLGIPMLNREQRRALINTLRRVTGRPEPEPPASWARPLEPPGRPWPATIEAAKMGVYSLEGFLSKFPGAAHDMLQALEAAASTGHRWFAEWSRILLPSKKAILKGPEVDNLREMLMNVGGVQAINPRVQAAFERIMVLMHHETGIIPTLTKGLGVLGRTGPGGDELREFMGRGELGGTDWYPRVYTYDYIEKVLYEDKEGRPSKDRREAVESVSRRMQISEADAAKLIDETYQRDPVTGKPRAREAWAPGLVLPRGIELPGFVKDPHGALMIRLAQAARRLSEARHLGNQYLYVRGDRDRGREGWIDRIRAEQGTGVADAVEQLFNIAHGTWSDNWFLRPFGVLQNYESITKLPLAFVQNMSQPALLGIAYGLRPWMQATLERVGGLAVPSLRRRVREAAQVTGVLNRQILSDMMMIAGIREQEWLGHAAQWSLALWKWSEVDFNRSIAARAGQLVMERYDAKLRRGMQLNATDQRILDRLGVNPRTAQEQGMLTAEQQARGAWGVVDRTQFLERMSAVPGLFDARGMLGAAGPLLTQWKGFSVRYGRFIWQEIFQELWRGNPWPLARFMLVAPAMGELVGMARAAISGRDRRYLWELDDGWDLGKRYFTNILEGFGLGIGGDILQKIGYGTTGTYEWLSAASLSQVIRSLVWSWEGATRLWQARSGTADAERRLARWMRDTGRALVREVPLVGRPTAARLWTDAELIAQYDAKRRKASHDAAEYIAMRNQGIDPAGSERKAGRILEDFNRQFRGIEGFTPLVWPSAAAVREAERRRRETEEETARRRLPNRQRGIDLRSEINPIGAAAAKLLATGPGNPDFYRFLERLQAKTGAAIPPPPVHLVAALAKQEEARVRDQTLADMEPARRAQVEAILALRGIGRA